MKEARRRLRVCLICVVAAAVIVGCIYYFGESRHQDSVNKGTLVCAGEEAGQV